MYLKKKIRNSILAAIVSIAVMGCSKKPTLQTYTIACDANGNPVLVTAKN